MRVMFKNRSLGRAGPIASAHVWEYEEPGAGPLVTGNSVAPTRRGRPRAMQNVWFHRPEGECARYWFTLQVPSWSEVGQAEGRSQELKPPKGTGHHYQLPTRARNRGKQKWEQYPDLNHIL